MCVSYCVYYIYTIYVHYPYDMLDILYQPPRLKKLHHRFYPNDTVDGCEILHQLMDGKHPIIYRVSTIRLVVQDFATIHSILK